jgi:SAM-dependent methyltransferase
MLKLMDKSRQIEYYEGLLEKHGESYLALDWNSPESQRLRFKVLKEIFVYGRKSTGISVLDVGCGFGDFYGFLKAEGVIHRNRISYTGYDIAPRILEVARRKYPDARFELKDVLEDRRVPKFDYVFCSGALTLRTSEKDEHFDFVKEMLFRMYDLCSCGVAVNFLSEGALPISSPEDTNSGRYFFFKPEEIVNFVRFVCNRFILRHDYHAGDFTVYMFK